MSSGQIYDSIGGTYTVTTVRALRDDLASGRWADRNRELFDLEAAELGLRLLIADPVAAGHGRPRDFPWRRF